MIPGLGEPENISDDLKKKITELEKVVEQQQYIIERYENLLKVDKKKRR